MAAATSPRPSWRTSARSKEATETRDPSAPRLTGATPRRVASASRDWRSCAPVSRWSPWKAPSSRTCISPWTSEACWSALSQPPSVMAAEAGVAQAASSVTVRAARRRMEGALGAAGGELESQYHFIERMTLTDKVRADLTSAMRAGEKDRVGTLRLVLSELQKDAKEGAGDEVAVLRRERKRRHESARAFRDGGRPELAEAEEAEAVVIEGYLPAELSDDELDRLVAEAIAETGASSPKDMGAVMKAVMAKAGGRAD